MDQPVKFINHEVADSLDSSNAFEGPEKLIELWFPVKPGTRGLLEISRQQWETMLDLVHCKVLSVLSYDHVSSYVLSESSFFVFQDKLVLKTCGTTTLLEGLPKILEIVGELPLGVVYSRRGFLFPQRQLYPHRQWVDEVKVLKKYFPDGEAREFGDAAHEKWYIFTALMDHEPAQDSSNLQLMMCGLDPNMAKLFHVTPELPASPNSDDEYVICEHDSSSSRSSPNPMEASTMSVASVASSCVGVAPDDGDPGHEQGNVMTCTTKVDEIYPTTTDQAVDSFAFSPCGYSCNGIVSKKDYFTIHVTPENGFSYASFESSVDPRQFKLEHSDIILRVLNIFRPKEFTVVLADNKELSLPSVHGYKCTAQSRFVAAGRSTWYKSYTR